MTVKLSKKKLRKIPTTYSPIDVPYIYRYKCFYCGEPASQDDHVPPVSRYYDFMSIYDTHKPLTVPCCSECNIDLGDSLQADVFFRFDECKKLLVNKLSKVIRMGELWDEDSVKDSEVTGDLKRFIDGLKVMSAIAKDRIEWTGWPVSVDGKTLLRSDDVKSVKINGKTFTSIENAIQYANKALKIPIPYLEKVLALVGDNRLQYAVTICMNKPVKSAQAMESVIEDLKILLKEMEGD